MIASLRLGLVALATLVTTAAATAPQPDGTVAHHPRVPGPPDRSAGWSSSNWSGYAKSGGPFTAATATWTVPSVSPSRKPSYSSSWVGVDGFSNSSLIQTGTEQDYYSGSAHYYAWWEILPAAETPIGSITVSPGDRISASVAQASPGTWTISIADTSNGQSFSTTQSYGGPLTSAEWIEEAPTIGGHVATLAHYSSPATFDPGTANGVSPALAASDGGVMIQGGRQVSTPSAPDADADGFNVSYGASAPQPPPS